MKNCKRLIACILEIAVGLILLICNFAGLVDEFWSGMGTALIVVGGIQLIRNIRYRTNETYREAVDVRVNDERNKYLAQKAWAWAGYLYVMIAACATIVFKLLGHDVLMYAASGSVYLIITLYWVSYLFLRKKY